MQKQAVLTQEATNSPENDLVKLEFLIFKGAIEDFKRQLNIANHV